VLREDILGCSLPFQITLNGARQPIFWFLWSKHVQLFDKHQDIKLFIRFKKTIIQNDDDNITETQVVVIRRLLVFLLHEAYCMSYPF